MNALFPDEEEGLHGRQPTFERHWRERHARSAREMLRNLEGAVRADVFTAMAVRLQELGIDEAETQAMEQA